MNKSFSIFLMTILIIAGCGTGNPPERGGWCYKWDFTLMEHFNAAWGYWLEGEGYISEKLDIEDKDEYALSLSYSSDNTVNPTQILIVAQRVDGGDISVVGNGTIFGIAGEVEETLPQYYNDPVPIYFDAPHAGTIGTDANVSVVSSGAVKVLSLTVYGRNDNPFGTSNCGDIEATDAPGPSPSPSALPSKTITMTPTPTPSVSPTPSPTVTPTATLDCIPSSSSKIFEVDDPEFGGVNVVTHNGVRMTLPGDGVPLVLTLPDFWHVTRVEAGLRTSSATAGAYRIDVGDFTSTITDVISRGQGVWVVTPNKDANEIVWTPTAYNNVGFNVTLRSYVRVDYDTCQSTPTPAPTYTPSNTFTPEPTNTPGGPGAGTPTATRTPAATFTPRAGYQATGTPNPSRTPYPVYRPPSVTPGPTETPNFALTQTVQALQQTQQAVSTQHFEFQHTVQAATAEHLTTAEAVGTQYSQYQATAQSGTLVAQEGIASDVEGLAGEIAGLGGSIIGFGGNSLNIATQWRFSVQNLYTGFFNAWKNTPAIGIPGLPACRTNPLQHQVCAIWYILRWTIFAGGVGQLLLPVATVVVDIWIIVSAIRLIRATLARFGKIKET